MGQRRTWGALALGLMAALATSAEAGGGRVRMPWYGVDPYHSGYLYVPPASAYMGPSVMPPARYGFPSYYVTSSYLPAGMTTPSAGQYGSYGYYVPYATFPAPLR